MGKGWPAVALLGALALAGASARAAEYINSEEPAPESVEELDGPLRRGFEELEELPPLLPRLKTWLARYPAFVSDTKLQLRPRLYYFNRDNADGTRSRATAIGGSLAYESGWWKDLLQMGIEGFTSQPLIAHEDEGGTGLLKPVQQGFGVIGTAYARLQWRKNVLTVYRQKLDLPFINGNDSRMVPNTFQGGLFNRSVGSWRYYVGHLTHIKPRNSDDFVPMSRAAGLVDPTGDGLTVAGGAWTPSEKFTIGGLTYFLWDVYNTVYLEADWLAGYARSAGLRLGLQGAVQTSVGKQLLGSFETWMLGARASFGWRGAIFTAAFNQVGQQRAIQSPFGGYPGYLSSMLSDFREAGERSWGLSVSYNFQRVPLLKAVSFSGRVVRGVGGSTASPPAPLPDRWETDVTFDYRVRQGALRGLWIRLRWALLRNDRAPDEENLRLIFRWDLPVL